MDPVEVILQGDVMRTSGLAATGHAELLVRADRVDDPALREVLLGLAAWQLGGGEAADGVETPHGYWDVVLKRRDAVTYELHEWTPDRSELVPGVATTLRYLAALRAVAERFAIELAPPRPTQMVAISAGVREGRRPLEATRYPAPAHMSGWYVTTDAYDGNIMSLEVGHLYHLTAARPELVGYLALPPGHWFEQQEGRVEVFFNPEIVNRRDDAR